MPAHAGNSIEWHLVDTRPGNYGLFCPNGALYADKTGLAIDYRNETVEAVVARGGAFDIVLAMEVVEHVSDVQAFVEACARAVRPGGLLVMATLNRTLRSFALAIVGAEYVLGWLPKGTHQWEKFVTPEELALAFGAAGFVVADRQGVTYNPLRDRWSLSPDLSVNYMLAATRREDEPLRHAPER